MSGQLAAKLPALMLILFAAASTAHAASGAPTPAPLPAALLVAGPIAGPMPSQHETMRPISRPPIAAEPTTPVRFAAADAEFGALLGKRLPLPVDGPFADLLRSVRPIPAPVQKPIEVLTARAD